MAEQLSEYQLFRLQKLQASYDEDNNSAHFSNKGSVPDFTERVQASSTRSSPNQMCQSLQIELSNQRRLYSELQAQHQDLNSQFILLQNAYEELKAKFAANETETIRLKNMLESRLEKERATKGKLKQWVVEAKQHLDV